jgi:translation initiation factor 3 subunit H
MSAFNTDGSVEAVQHIPIQQVVIDGLAVLKIVKHCQDSLPTMVAGSLLGLDVQGTLEITYSYAFPIPKSEAENAAEGAKELDGVGYQIEMMKMLRDVNIDNNCVGWYQSTYFGSIYTGDVINNQFSYQLSEDISDNSILIMYDPVQSKRGNLVMKAFRLTDKYVEIRRNESNKFIHPSEILQELPLKIRNAGLVAAFLRCMKDTHLTELGSEFDALSMAGSEAYTEKHLEILGTTIEDLASEQQRFQQYSKSIAKPRQEHIRWLNKRLQENAEAREEGAPELPLRIASSGLKPLMEAPLRGDSLLAIGQIDRYCKQVNEHIDSSVQKILLTSQIGASS